MKRTPIFYLKTILVIIGFIILFLSGMLVFSTVRIQTLNDLSGMVDEQIFKTSGFRSPLWFAIVAGTVIIFGIGYFFNHIVNRVLVFVFIPMFAIALFFLSLLFTFNISIDFPVTISELNDGYTMAIIGSAIVLTATVISVLRKRKIHKTNDNDLLLDN